MTYASAEPSSADHSQRCTRLATHERWLMPSMSWTTEQGVNCGSHPSLHRAHGEQSTDGRQLCPFVCTTLWSSKGNGNCRVNHVAEAGDATGASWLGSSNPGKWASSGDKRSAQKQIAPASPSNIDIGLSGIISSSALTCRHW